MDSALAFQSLSLILQSFPFPLITAQLVLLITLHSMIKSQKYFLVVGWRSTNTCLRIQHVHVHVHKQILLQVSTSTVQHTTGNAEDAQKK